MRALITGGRGFVGGWLAEHLRAAGDEVVAIDQEVEITDPAAVLGAVAAAAPDAVYHLAALTHVGDSWDDPLRVLQVNVLGTAVVLAAARRCGPDTKVLVTSSAEVYGAVSDDALPLSEETATAPLSPYAASKLAAEAVCAQAHAGHGQPVLVVRPFNHIGPGQSPNFAVAALARRITTALAEGRQEVPVGNLSARRDFTDVRDVVRAYRLLVERGEPGRVYNVCSGTDWSIREVADALLRQAGATLDLRADPDLVRAVEVPVLRGDPSRLHAATGWKPEIPFEQTLADVLDRSERTG